MHWFLKFILEWNSTCFEQFFCPSSGVFHWTHSYGICHTRLLTYTNAVCTVKNSWWWTEELSETCRVSPQNKFEKLVYLVGFIIRICHDARSHERKKTTYSKTSLIWNALVMNLDTRGKERELPTVRRHLELSSGSPHKRQKRRPTEMRPRSSEHTN